MSKLGEEFKVAVIGEIMLTRPLSVYEDPDFLSVINLFRDADVAITNIEGFGFNSFQGAADTGGGTPMCGESWLVEEFEWMGFNLVTIANNHTMDYGAGGLLAALETLDCARLAYAGAGRDLWEARQPGYVETRRGRAAMIGSSSAFMHLGRESYNALHKAATEGGKGLPGRPGLNPLRHDIIYTVTRGHFEEFKKINEQWKVTPRPLHHIYPKINKEEITFLKSRIVAGETPGIEYIPLKQDVDANLRGIMGAKKNASLVVAANHSHETDPNLKSEWGNAPPEFIRKYARDCIDAGADIYYGSGDHTGQGIEIYKGRPIFYSLANPIVTSPNIKRLPIEEYERGGLSSDAVIAEFEGPMGPGGRKNYATDRWCKSVVASFTLRKGELTELKLHPIDTTNDEPVATFVNRGNRPLTAKGEEARKIIERYAGLSAPFGTKIDFEDDIGIVEL